MTTAEWYAAHGCDHAHCPHDCEHPQPFMVLWRKRSGNRDRWVLVCGRCAILDQKLVAMIPCTPEVCT